MFFACSPEKKQQITATSFQCIPSQSACEVVTDFGLVSIKFNVQKVLTELPFQLRMELKDVLVDKENISDENLPKASGYMEGKAMFMGKIPLFFEQQNENNKSIFTAETMLGSCSEDIMTWRLWLIIEKQGQGDDIKQTTFSIEFDSTRF
jgi:hypothetical protein